MTRRENFLSLVRRQGYDTVPYGFNMCPSLAEKFSIWCRENDFTPDLAAAGVPGIAPAPFDRRVFDAFYRDKDFKAGTVIDDLGVAHEPGSAAAYHMTRMHHPMQKFDSVEQIQAYPFLDYEKADVAPLQAAVEAAHARDQAAIGGMQCTIWETAWYMRGMNELMMDMLTDGEMAEAVLDRVTHNAVLRAEAYARAGADVLFLGDDVGMQQTIMMSESMYCEWIQPRLKRVIDAAKAIKPDMVTFYHSCGYVTPLIGRLIEAGVDVLNPVQPECMDFAQLHEMYGDRISFNGTLGTQTTMPFGTPQEVRHTVFRNLDIAGKKGGLLPEPTHVLEPEVPVENVVAYIRACEEYTR